jgi:hypothetical protein
MGLFGGGKGGGGGNQSGVYGPTLTPAESAQLAYVSAGSPAPNVAGPTSGQAYPTMGVASPNINTAAAQGLYSAGGATAAGLGRPLLGSNIAAYQNPYTDQVIKANEADILRGGQMGLNALDTAAGKAGAFGGSRHGIATGELGRNVMQQLAQSSAGLRQAGFQNAQQAAQFDITQNQAAAQQLANIAQQGFGMGQTVQQNLMAQGNQQQALQQALIDAAKGQYAGYTGHPAATLGYVSNALGATPVPQSQTTSKQPGLFDYLTLAATTAGAYYGAGGSDIRFKTDITLKKVLDNGIKVYDWVWNELGEKFKAKWQPSSGVIAQEIKDVIPEAVIERDGYLFVDYNHPELKGAL